MAFDVRLLVRLAVAFLTRFLYLFCRCGVDGLVSRGTLGCRSLGNTAIHGEEFSWLMIL